VLMRSEAALIKVFVAKGDSAPGSREAAYYTAVSPPVHVVYLSGISLSISPLIHTVYLRPHGKARTNWRLESA